MGAWLAAWLHGKDQVDEPVDEPVDLTLTPSSVKCVLTGLSSRWYYIGAVLRTPYKNLESIRYENNDDRRLSAVILHWMINNRDCTWGAVKDLLRLLGKPEYIEKVYQLNPQGPRKKCPLEDALNHRVHLADLKGIEMVLRECCPLIWYEIGLQLGIPKTVLDVIDRDYQDTYRKLIEMLYTWIVNADERSTWRELVNILKKLKKNDAAEKIELEHLDMNLPPKVDRPVYDSTGCKAKEEKQLQKNEIMQSMRTVLKVSHDVSDKDLITGMAQYIEQANLDKTELHKVVHEIEALQESMSESSTVLRTWATALKKDLRTAETVKEKLCSRQQHLEKIQCRLERNRKIIQEHSHLSENRNFIQRLIVSNQHQEQLKAEMKLKLVQKEIRQSVKDLDWANVDYQAISTKLNTCQIELEACVEEWQRFQDAVESSRGVVSKLIAFARAAAIGGVVGGFIGSAGGPLGAALGVGIGATIGGTLGANDALLDKEFDRLMGSCVSEISETKCELQATQDLLNYTRNPVKQHRD